MFPHHEKTWRLEILLNDHGQARTVWLDFGTRDGLDSQIAQIERSLARETRDAFGELLEVRNETGELLAIRRSGYVSHSINRHGKPGMALQRKP